MAASYTRRINLYINGKEVSADLVSIRREMSKLVNEQARMTLGSKEYVAHASKIKSLKRIIDQHNQDLSTTHKKWNMFQQMADASNRYFAIITAAIASLTGIVMVIKSTVTAFAEFDDKLVDVMKTTDLTKKQTKELNTELKKIDTRTAQIDLLSLARVAGKLGIRGKEDILGFVRATDKIRVALSEDLGGDTEESVRQLGKLVDIFKLTKDFSIEDSLLKIGSAMNALGASGTANEGYMLEFSKRVAGVAPNANITIDKILGLATTLDELGQTSEVSATAFNQVISKMFKDTAKFAHIAGMSLKDFTDLLNKDANEAMIQLLLGAKGSAGGFGELANSLGDLGMDGVRATTVLASLAANIEKLRENQKYSNEEFVKGTDLLTEYNKKNTSAQATLEKHVKTFKDMQVVLGEKLTPIYAETIHKASTLLKVFGATVEFLFKYGGAILFATGYLLTYAVAVKLVAMWEGRKNIASTLGLFLTRANMIMNRAGSAAMLLYAAAVAVLEGNFKRAAVAMRLFMAFAAATPLGILAIALGAVITAVKAYDTYSKEARDREYERAKSLKDLNILTGAYVGHVGTLTQALKDSTTQTRAQKLATAEMADEMIEAAVNTLRLEKLQQEALQKKFTTATLWQKTWNLIKSGGNAYLAEAFNIQDAAMNGINAAAQMDDGINELVSSIIALKSAAKDYKNMVFAESRADKIGSESLVMMNEKLSIYKVALDNAIFGGEDYIRIREKMNAVEAKISKPVWNSDEEIKSRIDILEASFNKEQSIIRQGYLQGLMNEDEFNDELLLSELKFLADKLKIYNVGTKEYQEAVNKALELQVAVDNKLRDLQIKAEDELAAANIENIRDEFERLEEAEKERWRIEKQALEKRQIDKAGLNTKEQAINDAIYAQIEAKEKAHQQKMRDLGTGKSIAEKEQLVTAATPFDTQFSELAEMQKMFAAKTALIEAQYENEKALAAGNNAFLLAAEKNHNNALIQLKLDLIDAEFLQKEQRIAAGQEFIGALSGMVDQETALGKALFLFNQGLAIAEIWVSLAKANAAALLLGPGAVAMIPFNTAIAVAQTALVLSQAVKAFQSPSAKGYSEGGPTPPGGKNEPAGIVHKGEYVVSKQMLADPQVKYITEIFEKMRTRKISLNRAAFPVLSSGGFSSVNKVSLPTLPSGSSDNSKLIGQQNKINLEMTRAINKFMEYRPTVAVETIEREREKYIRIKQTHGL